MYPVYNQFMDSYPSHHHMNQMHSMPYQSWQPYPGYGFPGFSYYPGYFAPPPMFYGGYPAPPAPPMPYRAMQMPFYGPGNMFESNGQYCCSCPNHQLDHKMKDGNNVKIEDDSGKIPRGFMENGAEEKEKKSHGAEKERESRSELSGEERGFLNKLIPSFMEGSGSRIQRSDSSGKEEHEEDQNQDADKGKFPFPLIWMPYNLDDKSMEKKEKEESTKNNGVSNTPERNKVPRVVPVKSLLESTDERTKNSSMKNVNGGKENGKPSSPPRSSRLPPVCLRVDPVHKKKNGSGGSRSPSPPRDKNESSSKDVEQHERKAKTIEVSEGLSKKDEARDQNVVKSQVLEGITKKDEARERNLVKSQVSEGMTKQEEAKDQNLVKSQVVAADGEANEPKVAEKSADGRNASFSDNIGGSEKVNVRRNLSEGEAATMIQSAYRGYEVRRWEPLKKLKQISGVRDEVVKLGCEISSDAVNDDKRSIAIEESIMNLLLKLDTIQGLHPSIRDVRKSVARELVSLQEKIDHLSRNGPEIPPDQESSEDLNPRNQEREEVSSHQDQESGKELDPGNQESGDGLDSGNQEREGVRSHCDQESGEELDPGNQESGEEFDPQNIKMEGARSHCDQESGEELDPGNQEREGRRDQESVAGLDPGNQESGEELNPRNQGKEGVKSHPDQELGKELDPGNQEWGEELDLENQEKEGLCDQVSGEELDPGKQEKEESGEELDHRNQEEEGHPDQESGEELNLGNQEEEGHPDHESGEELDPGNQERDQQSMAQESQEGEIVMENGAAIGNDPTDKHQEIADDCKSLTGKLVMEDDLKGKDLTEEPQEAIANLESRKGETVMEDETQEKILIEQSQEVLNEDVLNSKETLDLDLKSSSNAEVVLGSCESPTEAPEVKEGHFSPPPPPSSLGNKKLIEENEKLREMMHKLIESGNQRISTISELSGRVEDLEKKLRRKNRLKMRGKNRKACGKNKN